MEGNETVELGELRWEEEDDGGGGGGNFSSPTITEQLSPQVEVDRRQLECNTLHISMPTPLPSFGVYCPRTFDGWSCWNDTPAGETAYVHCPSFVPGFQVERLAHKDCDLNGTWFIHPDSNQTWSNYTTCVDLGNLELHQGVNTLYIAGYCISLVALCISLFIFCFFKSLKCTRVTIHKNLFVSFIINNGMWLLWFGGVVQNPDMVVANPVGCQVLHIFLHYFLVANYFWMFCEGLYLHTLLVVAFVAEERIMKWFYMLGWGSPGVLIIIYGACRGTQDPYRIHCWMEDGVYNYILSVPVVFSVFVNMLFLINIVRVLVTKLRAVHTGPDTHSTRKAVRATLILIPLLGLHYLLVPFKPPEGSPAEFFHLIVSAIAASFQGLAVSFLFCFFNGEVLALFKKKWNQHKLMSGANTMTLANTTFSEISCSRDPSISDPRTQPDEDIPEVNKPST